MKQTIVSVRPLTTKLLKSLPQAISLLDGQHLFALYPKKKKELIS